jgi:hypothetical protein
MRTYDVYTDLSPAEVTEAGYAIMELWIGFALGMDEIHGHRIENPTGRYASSIRLEGRGIAKVAVIADEALAPESKWLEEGHGAVDLKEKLTGGRVYPMHRGAGAPILSSTFAGRTNNVWAASRAEGFNGFARVPSKITPENVGSWVIPAMPAWSPASYLADLLRG